MLFCVMNSPDLVVAAYHALYGKDSDYSFELVYNGRLKGFNASIRKRGVNVTLVLSKQWKDISKEIQVGIVQDLFNRLFRSRKSSINIDLYHNFLKGVHVAIPKTRSHPLLEASFNRVNSSFFYNGIEMPNLVLGKGLSRLGTYNYGTDTISISRHLLKDNELLDYVMYHEVLHKVHKYKPGILRSTHHSGQFRRAEQAFPNSDELEKRLSHLGRRSWFPF